MNNSSRFPHFEGPLGDEGGWLNHPDPRFDRATAVTLTPAGLNNVIDSMAEGRDDFQSSSWYPLPPLDPNDKPPRPSLLQLGNQFLLYAGRVNNFQSLSEAGKTWLGLVCVAQELKAGNIVLYCDFEDHQSSMQERLRQLGVAQAAIDSRFKYVNPDDQLTADLVESLAAYVEAWDVTLVVIDGVTDAIGLLDERGREDFNARIVRFKRTLTAPLSRTGAAVLTIDHMPFSRNGDRSTAIGGVQKKNTITGSSFTLENVSPLGRGQVGTSKLYLTKDRAGHIEYTGKNRYLGSIEFISEEIESGVYRLTVRLVEADNHDAADVAVDLKLCEEISRHLETSRQGQTGNSIATSLRVTKRRSGPAIKWLQQSGYISERPHQSVKPYRPDTP